MFLNRLFRPAAGTWLVAVAAVLGVAQSVCAADPPLLVRSAKSGDWSAAGTWEGGNLPAAGERVQIREGHVVRYDVKGDRAIRSIHVAGTLSFATDKDTRLDVGLIKIQA